MFKTGSAITENPYRRSHLGIEQDHEYVIYQSMFHEPQETVWIRRDNGTHEKAASLPSWIAMA